MNQTVTASEVASATLAASRNEPTDTDYLSRSIELIPIPMFIADAENRYVAINRPARKFLDYGDENLHGASIWDIFHLRELENSTVIAAKTANCDREERYELEFIRRDGTIVCGEVISCILPDNNRQILIYDVTERRRAEQAFTLSDEHLWQNHKYEALGKLAGGVAHDFNNFLAVIMLQTGMLGLELPADSPFQRRVNEIKASVNNAAETVRQLLAFGRRQPMNPDFVNLNHSLSEFSKILPAFVKENIEVRFELHPHLGVCFVDRRQFEEILLNLTRNAVEAMPGGGVLEFKTVDIFLDKNTVRHQAQPVGAYIQLTVADSGGGMDSTVLEHLFEPCFSTKSSDRSAGLGMATVYGIVKQSKGFIWVESEINRGTIFTIQFPNIEQNADSDR